LYRLRCVSFVKEVTSRTTLDMSPVRLLLARVRLVTRPVLGSVVTPCHLERGASLHQLVEMVQLKCWVEIARLFKACRSSACCFDGGGSGGIVVGCKSVAMVGGGSKLS